jgi:hypothetical protein
MQALAALLFPSALEPPCEPDAEGAGSAGRRALQERFLASDGLRVVCGLVDRLVAARTGDAALLRELGQLVVVLIHNLMDAATPRPLAAGPALSPVGAAGPAEAAAAAIAAEAVAAAAAAAEAEMGDSAMADVEEASDAAAGGEAALAVAAAAAAAGAGLGSSSNATPVRLAELGALKDADRASRPGSAESDETEAAAAVAGVGTHPAKAGTGPAAADDKQHAPDQRQQPLTLPPRLRAPPQPVQRPARAAAPPSLSLDAATLRLMSRTLLQLAVQGARLWGAPPALAAPDPDSDTGSDVALVREALSLLQRALDLRPELLAPLLAPGGGGGAIVTDLLLSPHYQVVRAVAEDSLARVCCAAPEPLDWLLAQLSAARPLAAARPGASGQFYRLFARAVRALQGVEGVPQGAYLRAEGLLADEVAALQALPPAGGDDENVALEVGALHWGWVRCRTIVEF